MNEVSPEPPRDRFVRASATTLGTQVAALAAGLATSIVLARVLGPSGKGTVAIALVAPAIASAFINLGIDNATTYNVARRGRPLPELIGTGVVLSVIAGVIGAVLTATALVLAHARVAPGIAVTYAFVALTTLPGSLVWNLLDGVPLGLQQYGTYNLLNIIGAVTVGTATIVSVSALHGGVLAAILTPAVTYACLSVVTVLWFRRRYDGISFALHPEYVREALKYGAQVNVSNIVAFLNYRVDVLLLGNFLQPAAVGVYTISFAIAEKLWLLSLAASVVLFPRVASVRGARRGAEFTALVTRTVLMITAAGALLLAFVAPVFVRVLFSARFAGAITPLRALLVGIVAFSGARILANDIAARGRPLLNAYVSLVGLIINVVLNLVWIPRYGITGAGLASSVSYTSVFIARLLVFSRLTGVSPRSTLLPRRSDLMHYVGTVRRFRSWSARGSSGTGNQEAGTESPESSAPSTGQPGSTG